MTVLEERFFESAAHFFSKKSDANWSDRRFLAASLIMLTVPEMDDNEAADYSVRRADALLSRLKSSKI